MPPFANVMFIALLTMAGLALALWIADVSPWWLLLAAPVSVAVGRLVARGDTDGEP